MYHMQKLNSDINLQEFLMTVSPLRSSTLSFFKILFAEIENLLL